MLSRHEHLASLLIALSLAAGPQLSYARWRLNGAPMRALAVPVLLSLPSARALAFCAPVAMVCDSDTDNAQEVSS